MGFIQAFTGAISGTLSEQWIDFYVPDSTVSATCALFPAIKKGEENGRGLLFKKSTNIITNGSKVVVPEGMGLITFQDGAITNLILEAGGYEYSSSDPNSQSIFAGDGFKSLISMSWRRFKFMGAENSQQLAYYVNLKEIPNNKFGTQSEIYWDDAFFNTQVGAMTRGTYTLKITDPILFVKNFVPSMYYSGGEAIFDFADLDNDAANQLFTEVVSVLSGAFSIYTNDPSKGNRMAKIQADQIGFAKALSEAVESAYKWKENRGLEIVSTSILSIEYDQDTKKLMSDVKKADALSGARGDSFLKQSIARGMENAGSSQGGMGMAFMGMGLNASNNIMGQLQTNEVSPTEKLLEMKKLLDAGAISEEEYNTIKAKLLGI